MSGSNGNGELAFGEFLIPNKRPYTLSDDEDANLVGMRLYGGGPFHRELKPANKIRKKSHFVIRSGDIIYNKLFAWKGTFGIVPDSLDSMFVSDKFPTYAIDDTKVDPQFLQWYFRQRIGKFRDLGEEGLQAAWPVVFATLGLVGEPAGDRVLN